MEQPAMTTRRLLLIILGANTTHKAGTYHARQRTRPNVPGNKQLLHPGGFKNYFITLKHIWLLFYILFQPQHSQVNKLTPAAHLQQLITPLPLSYPHPFSVGFHLLITEQHMQLFPNSYQNYLGYFRHMFKFSNF